MKPTEADLLAEIERWKSLLTRYRLHVIDNESVDFLYGDNNNLLSRDERALIRSLPISEDMISAMAFYDRSHIEGMSQIGEYEA